MFNHMEEIFKSHGIQTDDIGNFVSIRSDLKTNCQFLITHFLCSSLSIGRRVLFVTMHETYSHNAAIAAKLGINLQKYQQEGKLRVVDGTQMIVDSKEEDENDPFGFMYSDNDCDYDLKNFFNIFKKNINDWRSDVDNCIPYTVIIDRINVFYSLGIPQKEILIFTKKVLAHIYNPVENKSDFLSKKPLGSLYISSEVLSSIDSQQIADSLSSLASKTLFTYHLATGRSATIDGNLGIMHTAPSGLTDVRTYHYKVSEKNVSLFAHGMDATVL